MTETQERAQTSAPPKRRPRIGFISWAGVENLGNDGCLESIVSFIREKYPDAELISISPGPELVEKMFDLPGVDISWMPKRRLLRGFDKLALKIPSAIVNSAITERTLGKIDYLIFAGTSLVDDYRTDPIQKPLTFRRWLKGAHRRGVKILYLSVGADPVRNPLSRWLIRPVARLATYRSYRDPGSRAYLASIDADDADAPVAPDLVWRLPTPPDPPRPANGPLTVGIGVMAYHGWRDAAEERRFYDEYVDKITQFADWLADEGHFVRLLVGEKSDRRVVTAVSQRARCVDGPKWIEPTPADTLHQLMAQMTETDVVLASRFHNILCAFKLGRPTFSLGYMSKCTELLDLVGTPGYSQMIEEFDLELLKRQFSDMIAKRAELTQTIRASLADIDARMRAQEANVLKIIV